MLDKLSSTIFKLVDIDEIEPIDTLSNMIDIQIDEDESFCFADGIISHNSALGYLLKVRDKNMHGGYPLRGKVLNTWNKTPDQVRKNKELFEIMAILNLHIGKPASVPCSDGDFYEIIIDGVPTIVNENDDVFIDGDWVSVKSML